MDRCVECTRVLWEDREFERTSRGPLCGGCAPSSVQVAATRKPHDGVSLRARTSVLTLSRQALANPPRPPAQTPEYVKPDVVRRYREMAA